MLIEKDNTRLFVNLTPLNPPLLEKERGKEIKKRGEASLKLPISGENPNFLEV